MEVLENGTDVQMTLLFTTSQKCLRKRAKSGKCTANVNKSPAPFSSPTSTIMARRPKTSRKEVPPIKRGEMYGMHKGGASYAVISRAYPTWTAKIAENVCKQAGEREFGITELIILDAMKESIPEVMNAVADRILMLDNAKTHKIKEIKN